MMERARFWFVVDVFWFFGGAFFSVPMQGGNVERMACVNARGNAPMCLEVFANASLVDAACFQEQGLSLHK